MKPQITRKDFEKVDIRVGKIIDVKEFPAARIPAWKLRVDFGEEIGIKKSSAQITDLYASDDLVGKQIIGVVNFPPKQVGPFMSECLVLGLCGDNTGIILLHPDRETENGLYVS